MLVVIWLLLATIVVLFGRMSSSNLLTAIGAVMLVMTVLVPTV